MGQGYPIDQHFANHSVYLPLVKACASLAMEKISNFAVQEIAAALVRSQPTYLEDKLGGRVRLGLLHHSRFDPDQIVIADEIVSKVLWPIPASFAPRSHR